MCEFLSIGGAEWWRGDGQPTRGQVPVLPLTWDFGFLNFSEPQFLHVQNGHSPTYNIRTAAAAASLQSCPTLCDPTDGSPPGCSVPGILQARILEWVAMD